MPLGPFSVAGCYQLFSLALWVLAVIWGLYRQFRVLSLAAFKEMIAAKALLNVNH